ncbi:MAG: hypothetical protein WA906_08555 [Pacificimonas sp.]
MRALVIATLIAPALACLTLSPILATMKLGPLEGVPMGAAVLPMVFALPGAILLAVIFMLLGFTKLTRSRRYLALILAAPFLGAAILSDYDLVEMLLGALYAGLTAVLWVVIHRWLSARAANKLTA